MTSTHSADADLLDAVLDSPHDPDVALVYADLLSEQGRDDQAALTRLQCEFGCWTHSPRRRRREQDEMARLADRVLVAERGRRDLPRGMRFGLRFGLLTATASDFLTVERHMAAIDAARVRWLRVESLRGISRLQRVPAASRMRHLDLGEVPMGPRNLRRLAEVDALAGLLSLSVTVTSSGVPVLADLASAVPNLRHLRVRCPNGGLYANDLANFSARWPELEWVDFSQVLVPYMSPLSLSKRLTRLGLRDSPHLANGGGLAFLLRGLGAVRHLDLAGCRLNSDSAGRLAETAKVNCLERVHIPCCGIDRPGMTALKRQFSGFTW